VKFECTCIDLLFRVLVFINFYCVKQKFYVFPILTLVRLAAHV